MLKIEHRNAIGSIRRISLMLISALCFYSPAKCQDSLKLSLNDIFQRIETSYPEILAFEAKVKSIQSQAAGAKSWMAPTTSFGLDRFPYNPSMIGSKDDPMNQAGLMFSFEQMIPNASKLRNKQNYINSLAAIQQNNREWTKNILRSNAKLLYYNRYIAERKLKIIRENVDLLELFINTAEERYKYNQADLSVIYKAQASREDFKNMQSMLLSEIAESNIGLNILMNRDINSVFQIDTIVSLTNESSSNGFADTTVQKRNDIASMSSQIHSMQLNQEYMAAGKKPDFGIKATHMQMFGMPNQYSVMGMINIPIVPWSSKMYLSEVKSMGFEIEAMQRQREAMELMASRMINEKLSMLRFERIQLNNYENNIVPAYQKNLETSLLAYKQNTGSFFVLLDAWNMLLMKQMEYLDKKKNVLKLKTEYEFEIEKR